VLLLLFVVWVAMGVPGGRWIPVGANSVALGYAVDMISLLFSKGVPGYPDAWCGGSSVEDLASCTTKKNFPGPATTSYMDWDQVWKIGSQYPAKEWSGEWWRGNELGFIINNPKFWSNLGIDPLSIALGIAPKEHAAVRPTMEDMWTLEKMDKKRQDAVEKIVRRRVRDFFKQDTFSVPTDVTILVHQILNEVGLKRNVSYEYSETFVALQSQVVAMGTVSQLLPSVFYGLLNSISEGVQGYVQEYIPLIEALYGEKLAKEDCGPSKNCTVQAAAATWDALYAAGGLSVPGTISTGLGLLYSTSGSNPAPNVAYTKEEAAQFYWENIRYFPPVVGFPHWKTRPTCAGSSAEETAKLNKPNGSAEACPLGNPGFFSGYPDVNQYMGGVREVPNLALAMWDPRKWGDDSDKFVLRPLDDYDNFSVGFAEMAVDNEVADGRMNRICPGRGLALMIGTTFFEEFNQSDWKTPDSISWTSTTPFVGSFTLTSGTGSQSKWNVLVLLLLHFIV